MTVLLRGTDQPQSKRLVVLLVLVENVNEVGENLPLDVRDVDHSPDLDTRLVGGDLVKTELLLITCHGDHLEEEVVIEVPSVLPVLSAGLEGGRLVGVGQTLQSKNRKRCETSSSIISRV